MELKPFVKTVLKDIIDAVEETRSESSRDMHLTNSQNDRTVEFDIAVTVEDNSSASGKAGIKVFQVIEGGGNMSQENKNSTVSRIKFGVHIDAWTKAEETAHRAEVDRLNTAHIDNYE